MINVGRDGIGSVKNKSVDVNAINLVFRVVERVKQSLRNVNTSHREEEPLFFYLACSIHFKGLLAVPRIKAEANQLLETKDTRAAEVGRWVLALKANVNPLARQPIVEFFVRFKHVPETHKHHFMFSIFFGVLLYLAPGRLDLVVKANPVHQLVTSVKSNGVINYFADL